MIALIRGPLFFNSVLRQIVVLIAALAHTIKRFIGYKILLLSAAINIFLGLNFGSVVTALR